MTGEAMIDGKGLPVSQADGQETRVGCADWATAYPSGIPLNYNMAHHVGEEYPKFYIESYLPMMFYTEPPEDLKAIFSTKNGQLKPRRLEHVLPRRELKLWDAEKIQNTANSVRKKFWANMRSMPEPKAWADLYDYFDAHDIYYEGALNLWNLICQLWQENQNLLPDLYRTMSCEISIWADEWLEQPGHKEALLAWDAEETIDILNILSNEEMKDLRGVNAVDLVLARATLVHCRDQLKKIESSLPQPYPGNSLKDNWAEVNKWLAGQPVGKTTSGLFRSQDRPVIVCSSMYKDQATSIDAPISDAVPATGELAGLLGESAADGVPKGESQPQQSQDLVGHHQATHEPGTNLESSLADASPRKSSKSVTDAGKNDDKTPRAGRIGAQKKANVSPSVAKTQHHESLGLPTGTVMGGGYVNSLQMGSGMNLNNPGLVYNGTQFFRPFDSIAFQSVGADFSMMGKQQSPMEFYPQPPGFSHASEMGTAKNMNPMFKMPKNSTRAADEFCNPDSQRLSSLNPPRQRSNTNTTITSSHRAYTGTPVQSNNACNFRNNDSRGFHSGANIHGGWIQDGNHDLHGPTHRRSPQKHNGHAQGLGRQRAWPKVPSNGTPCPNAGPSDTYWDYIPCNCSICETRNRSVHISFKPQLQTSIPDAEIRETIHREMARYGEVEHVFPYKKAVGSALAYTARFKSAARIMEAANAPNIVCRELSCNIVTSAPYRSDYGAEWARMNGSQLLHGGNGRRNSFTQRNAVYGGQRPRLMSNATVTSQGSPRRASGSTPSATSSVMMHQLALPPNYFTPGIGNNGSFFPPQAATGAGAIASMGPVLPVGKIAQSPAQQYHPWYHAQAPGVSMPPCPAVPESGARARQDTEKGAASIAPKDKAQRRPELSGAGNLPGIKLQGEHVDVATDTVRTLSKACTVRLPRSPEQTSEDATSKKMDAGRREATQKAKFFASNDAKNDIGSAGVGTPQAATEEVAAPTTYASMLKIGSNQPSPVKMFDQGSVGSSAAQTPTKVTTPRPSERAPIAQADDPFVSTSTNPSEAHVGPLATTSDEKGKPKSLTTVTSEPSGRRWRQSEISDEGEGDEPIVARSCSQQQAGTQQEGSSSIPRNFSKSSVTPNGKSSKKKTSKRKKKMTGGDVLTTGAIQHPGVDSAGNTKLISATSPERIGHQPDEHLLSPSKRTSKESPASQSPSKRLQDDSNKEVCQHDTTGHPDITVTPVDADSSSGTQAHPEAVDSVHAADGPEKPKALNIHVPDSSLELPVASSPATVDGSSVAESWHSAKSRQTSVESLKAGNKLRDSANQPSTPPGSSCGDASSTPRRVVSAGSALNPKAREFASPAGGLLKRASAVDLRGLVPLGLGAQHRVYHQQHRHQDSIVSDTSSHTATPGCTPKNTKGHNRGNNERDESISPPPGAKPSFALRPAAVSYAPSTRAASPPGNAFSAQHASIEEQLNHTRHYEGGKKVYQPGLDSQSQPGLDTQSQPGVDTQSQPGLNTQSQPDVDTQSQPGHVEHPDVMPLDAISTEKSHTNSATCSDVARSRQPKHKKSKQGPSGSSGNGKAKRGEKVSEGTTDSVSGPSLGAAEFPALPSPSKDDADATKGLTAFGALTKLTSPLKSAMSKLTSGGVPKGEGTGSLPAKQKDVDDSSAGKEDSKQ
ncbi:hypothetical protein VD0002_g251 [Verticillium dahliae]|uniref:RRM domain-containing protein n=2 Tax=Verticillium dahliae TaxID=27337 RepID=A0A444RUC8_VERDA|nr:hypothetical protein VD0002_g251 [Verticillium dahliae]RXG44735.1 hypothetical protein VDGE_02510 [Verticillium dahliae]